MNEKLDYQRLAQDKQFEIDEILANGSSKNMIKNLEDTNNVI